MEKITLGDKIGEGGQGQVFMATYIKDAKTKQVVSAAVKKVPMSATDLEEIKLQAKLSKLPKCHEHVACYYNMHNDGKDNYIVMELITGSDLWEYVIDQPRLKLKQLKQLFRQALEGLAFIHSKGIAHGDIKLENFMISADKLKYIDFGFGCSAKTCASSPVLHGTGYLNPPEAFSKETIWSRHLSVPKKIANRVAARLDGAKTLQGLQEADRWALGSMFAELLMAPGGGGLVRTSDIEMTGKALKNADSRHWLASEHMARHRQKTRGRRHDRLYAIVDSLMKIDPDDRLSAQDALKILE